MDNVTVVMSDMNSSRYAGETFEISNVSEFKSALQKWIDEMNFSKYELQIVDYLDYETHSAIAEVIDEFGITV